jgi:hypothetical protein
LFDLLEHLSIGRRRPVQEGVISGFRTVTTTVTIIIPTDEEVLRLTSHETVADSYKESKTSNNEQN